MPCLSLSKFRCPRRSPRFALFCFSPLSLSLSIHLRSRNPQIVQIVQVIIQEYKNTSSPPSPSLNVFVCLKALPLLLPAFGLNSSSCSPHRQLRRFSQFLGSPADHSKMSLVANYTNCHNKLGSLPPSLSQVELAVSTALANTHNLVQNSYSAGSIGKKRVQCQVCFKTFCDKVSACSHFTRYTRVENLNLRELSQILG